MLPGISKELEEENGSGYDYTHENIKEKVHYHFCSMYC